MQRIRIEQKARRPKDQEPIPPMDPRDPDVLRAKRLSNPEVKDKRL